MNQKNEKDNDTLTPENITRVMQGVKDKLVLSKNGARAADLFSKFKGKQLVTTNLHMGEKKKNKKSNNPSERNSWKLLYDAQAAIQDELENDSSEGAQMIQIEDDYALQTRSNSNENFKILPFLQKHIKGKRAYLPHLIEKYKELDYSVYSDSLLIALREVYQNYSTQVHAALTPVLDGSNARHQQALTQARGDGWKLLRLVRQSNQDTGRNEIVTNFHKMLALNIGHSNMSGTKFLNEMEQATTELLASIKEHEDLNLNGQSLSAKDLVRGIAVTNTRTKLHKNKNLEQVIQRESQSHKDIFSQEAMTSLLAAVSTAESLAGSDKVEQEVAATTTSTSYPSYQQQKTSSHRQELHGIFADQNIAQQLNDGRGPGFPRQHYAPGVSLYYDYKEYLNLTGQGDVATATAQEWAKTNGLFPDKNATAQHQRNSQSIPNTKNWKKNVVNKIAALVTKQLSNGNKRSRRQEEEEENETQRTSTSTSNGSPKKRHRGNNISSHDDEAEEEEMSHFVRDGGNEHQHEFGQDQQQRSSTRTRYK